MSRFCARIVARVYAALVDLMLSGRRCAEDVAMALGVSRSTLQRRLRAEDTSYQAIVEATRRNIAVRYLIKTALDAEKIASVLPYRDLNSFSRSFRRWTGQSAEAFSKEVARCSKMPGSTVWNGK
jgi:AraC-like DNA-binding protein